MQAQVRRKMWGEMRRKEITYPCNSAMDGASVRGGRRRPHSTMLTQRTMQHTKVQFRLSAQPEEQRAVMRIAAQQLVDCYTALSERRAHLLSDMLGDELPHQWRHYPEDDVIDHAGGYQYFYHSHSPQDRKSSEEHGHFHLFARMDKGVHCIDEQAEQRFLMRLGGKPVRACTASLLCISIDSRGVPTDLFTTNRWVAGDHLLSAESTLRLIAGFRIKEAGPPLVNRWIAAMTQIFWPQIEELLVSRDRMLARQAKRRRRSGLLDDEELEILSSIPIDIDTQVALLG
jgi:hypothetical protein